MSADNNLGKLFAQLTVWVNDIHKMSEQKENKVQYIIANPPANREYSLILQNSSLRAEQREKTLTLLNTVIAPLKELMTITITEPDTALITLDYTRRYEEIQKRRTQLAMGDNLPIYVHNFLCTQLAKGRPLFLCFKLWSSWRNLTPKIIRAQVRGCLRAPENDLGRYSYATKDTYIADSNEFNKTVVKREDGYYIYRLNVILPQVTVEGSPGTIYRKITLKEQEISLAYVDSSGNSSIKGCYLWIYDDPIAGRKKHSHLWKDYISLTMDEELWSTNIDNLQLMSYRDELLRKSAYPEAITCLILSYLVLP